MRTDKANKIPEFIPNLKSKSSNHSVKSSTKNLRHLSLLEKEEMR